MFHQSYISLYVLIYVDDIIITGNSASHVSGLIKMLGSTFSLKDLGNLNYFLGVEITPHASGIILSQTQYIQNLLQKADMSSSKPVCTPFSSSSKLTKHGSSPLVDFTKYRQIVGSLQYLSLTRPDISFSVNKVCQYMSSPTEEHWIAVKRILRYLQHTKSYGLLISKESKHDLQVFTDADWAGCLDDRRSTTGFALYLGKNLISWGSHKQKIVACSSTESEYKALADTAAEIKWIWSLLSELNFPLKLTPVLWCDNVGATYLASNPIFHARTKHIEIDYHFVRNMVTNKELHVNYIHSTDNIADTLTKGLSSVRFEFFRSKLKVIPRTP